MKLNRQTPIGYHVEDKTRQIAYAKQRKIRGYDDSVLWNLDATLAILIYNFLDGGAGGAGLPLETDAEYWEETKRTIKEGCRLYVEKDNMTDDELLIWQKAKQLIAKHWESFWW